LEYRGLKRNLDKSDSGGQPPKIFVGAIRRILHPLVRILITHGVTFPMLSEILKRVYVDTAEKHFALEGVADPSDSRISLITRVHRKDVRRLRNEEITDSLPLASASLGAQIIAEWTGNNTFTDKKGTPLTLPRGGGAPKAPSFDALVASVSKDVRARAVLDELVRVGVVEQTPEDHVRLVKTAFVATEDFEELLVHFERNLHDHIAAAGSNLTGGAKPFLERSVYYDELKPQSVEALAKLAEEKAMESLLAVNKSARSRSKKDKGNKSASKRFTFGVYFYADDEEKQ
jgi:uncharacterized protein DUF6502